MSKIDYIVKFIEKYKDIAGHFVVTGASGMIAWLFISYGVSLVMERFMTYEEAEFNINFISAGIVAGLVAGFYTWAKIAEKNEQ